MSKDSRQQIKKNEGVEIKEAGVEEFYQQWKRWSPVWVMKQKRLGELKKAFGSHCRLWVSVDGGKIMSGMIVLLSADGGFYYQSFTTDKGRVRGAHYKLMWEAILKLKKAGLAYFDLEGIEDKRWPRKSFAGFSGFKKKWGGMEVNYAGSFTRWL